MVYWLLSSGYRASCLLLESERILICDDSNLDNYLLSLFPWLPLPYSSGFIVFYQLWFYGHPWTLNGNGVTLGDQALCQFCQKREHYAALCQKIRWWCPDSSEQDLNWIYDVQPDMSWFKCGIKFSRGLLYCNLPVGLFLLCFFALKHVWIQIL